MTRALSLCPVLLVVALVGLAAGGRSAGWESHAPMPEPRSEVAAGRAASELVVAGGFIADGNNSARADAYWPAGDRWRRLADLPASLDHAAGASANGRMYVIGGYGADRKPQRSVFVLEAVGGSGLRPCRTGALQPPRRSRTAACTCSAGATDVESSRAMHSCSRSNRGVG